uniref:Tudor domain-containing protein n=1 Tax=Macrostomum lignano TaxID=282301 RepID=A0A1I8H6A6_9PLAT
ERANSTSALSGSFCSYDTRLTPLSIAYIAKSPPNDSFLANITHIENLCSFYLLLDEDVELLRTTMSKIQEIAKSSCKLEGELHAGQPCLAMYTENFTWYRAALIANLDNAHYVVKFVDYGNIALVPQDFLRCISDEALKCSAFALHCSLADCDLRFYREEAITSFRKLLNKQLSVKVVDKDSIPIKVRLQFEKHDFLTSLHKLPTTAYQQAYSKHDANELYADHVKSSKSKHLLNCMELNWIVSKKSYISSSESVVSHASPLKDYRKLHLWIQSSRDLDELASLQSQLDVEAASSEALTAPQIGQFCIGLFEGGWYRAEVKAVSSDSIRVLFIDYGNEEEGSLDELQLKVLPKREELYRDAFAFECILQSSDNCCFSTDACDKIVEYGELQFSIDPSTDSEPPTVSIPKDILQSLTVIEVTDAAAANADSAAVIESGKQQIESQANKSETWAVSKSTQSGTFTGVVSLVTPSDDGTKLHLWIQSSRDLDELASLQSQLDVEAASSEALTAPQIGQFCIGLFEGGWYRAEVKAVSSDSIRVLFIDYGNEEEGSLDELQLKVLPQREELYRDVFAFECILQSSDNCCFSTDACDKIVEYGELQFSIDPSTDSEPPTVSIPKDILQSLTVIEVTDAAAANADSAAVIESGKQQIESQANKSETWAVSKSTQSGTFTGVVSLVTPSDDGTKLHLWIQSSRDLDELASLQSQLDVEAASSEALTAPQIGQFCIGLFEGGWYRAEVKAVSSDSIRVLFIDYGNEEEGSLDELQLKVLPQREELYRDVFAFECILQSSDNCCFSTDACDKIVEYGELQFSIDPSTDSEPPTVSIPKDILQSLTVIEVTDAAAANADSAAVIESGKQQIESQANKSETWAVSKSTQSGTFTGVVSLVTPSDDGTKLHLWIQSSRDLDELASLQSQLDVEAASSEALTAPQIGQFCIGLFEGGWYRAEVKAVSSDSIRVLFIDYGNEEEGSLDELQLKVLPQREELYRDVFAFECILQSSDNCCFSTDACDKIVEYGELQFSIDPSTDSEPPTVSIPKDILQSLTVIEVTDAAAANADSAAVIESGKQQIESQANKSETWAVSKSTQSGTFTGVVSLVTPSDDGTKLHLWIQSSRDLDELASLQSQLDVEAASSEALTAPQIGQFCIGLFEGGWYRAEVKAVSSDSIRVLFIDYGNEEEGSLDELQLKVLPQREELYRDAFAFECILESSDNCCFSTDACDKIVEYGELQFSIDPSTDSEPPTVSIPKDILQSLTVIEVTDAAAANADSAAVIESGKQQIESQANKSETWAVSKSTQSGTFTGVVSLVTPSDDGTKLHLWIQSSRDLDELASLQSQLDVEAASSEALTAPQIGQFCIGLFEGGWYRAEVKAVSSDSIRVLFIDYGNEEEGSLDELQLKVLPQREELYRDAFAFECILESSDNRCFSPEACDKIIEFGELKFSINCLLELGLPRASIADVLASSFNADCTAAIFKESVDVLGRPSLGLSARSKWPALKRPNHLCTVLRDGASSCSTVLISAAASFALEPRRNRNSIMALDCSLENAGNTDLKNLHLWVQNSSDFDKLTSLQNLLDADADSCKALDKPKAGQFCIGLFEGGWYRAEVKAVSSDSIRVLFIDYGNEEEGSLDELQLKVLPHREGLYRDALAFECILESSSKCRFTSNADALITAFDCLTVNIVQDFSSGLRTIGIDSDLLASLESRICSLEPISAAYDEPQKDAPVSSSTNDIREVRDASQHAIMEHDSRTKIWRVKRRQLTGTFTGTVCACVPTGDNKEYLRLWVHRTCDSVKLKALQDLFKIEADSAPDLKQPSLGQTCLVFHKDQWCRAEILATSSVTIELFLLDYGIECKWSVSKKHLFGLVSAMVVFAIQVQDDPRRLRLWIQSSRDLDELASLQSQLDIEAASSEAFTAPQIGQFCIGLFEGSWYRAEVKAVSSDSIRVLFIDYGNEEEGSLDELQLKVLPQREELYRDAFAFECILQSSDNCCFSTDACDKIVEYGELQFSIDPSTDSEPPTVSIPKDILQSLTVTEVTNSAASLASINNNKLKPAVLPASTSIFFDGENNENFHKSWCKVPLTPISYESGSDRPENSEVLATVCCLQPITNCSKQSNTCSSEAEKRQHQQYRPRLRYTPDQLRAVFASMVHDYGCTIVPTPVPLPGRYSVIILPSSNSSQLMVHLLPQSLQQVDRLAKRMHFWYNKLGLLIKPVTKLYPGKSVAFFTMKSHGGGEWYRGRVLSIDTRNSQEVSATVLAVDYGFVSSGLLTSFIRELPPDLTGPEWPAAICICRLASKDVLPQQPSLKRAGIEVLSDGTCCLLPPSKNADRNVEK